MMNLEIARKNFISARQNHLSANVKVAEARSRYFMDRTTENFKALRRAKEQAFIAEECRDASEAVYACEVGKQAMTTPA